MRFLKKRKGQLPPSIDRPEGLAKRSEAIPIEGQVFRSEEGGSGGGDETKMVGNGTIYHN